MWKVIVILLLCRERESNHPFSMRAKGKSGFNPLTGLQKGKIVMFFSLHALKNAHK